MAEPRRLVRRAELIATHPGFVDPDSTVIDRDDIVPRLEAAHFACETYSNISHLVRNLSKSSGQSVALGRPSDTRGTRAENRPSQFILEIRLRARISRRPCRLRLGVAGNIRIAVVLRQPRAGGRYRHSFQAQSGQNECPFRERRCDHTDIVLQRSCDGRTHRQTATRDRESGGSVGVYRSERPL